MLKLRKILLHDIIYIIITILVALLSIIRINSNKQSKYNINTNNITGIINKISKEDNKINIELKAKEKVLITYYNYENIDINLGDKIKVFGYLIEPQENTTENLFNYKKYLNTKNIYYIMNSKKIIKLKNNKNIYYSIKQIIIDRMENNKYLNTFILGDKTYIDNSVIRSYQENGISHLFAISGMHITLLATLIEKILNLFKIKEEQRFKIITTILIIYLFLVGLSPSILRGVLFYMIFSINRIYYFYIKSKQCITK